jgi:hypothetical protein
MILSVSRRTDIPALFADWFMDRLLKDKYFLVPNPFIKDDKIAKVAVEPVKVERDLLGGVESISGNVDGIIFWTKNPRPLMNRIKELSGFTFYFHFTLNPYDAKIEANVPPLGERVKTFQDLSRMIGADRVIWRYDPILLSKEISVDWHVEQFENLCENLGGFTSECNFSFLIGRHKDLRSPNYSEQNEILRNFTLIAKRHGIQLKGCALAADWAKFGITKSRCTDPDLFARLISQRHGVTARVKTKRLDAQRKNCGCMPCVDIGIYNTCTHGCVYCYANGFYDPNRRGEPKSMLDLPVGEIYYRKTERVFDY